MRNISVFTNFLDSVLSKSFEFFIMCGYPIKCNLRICPEMTVGNTNNFMVTFLTELMNLLSNENPKSSNFGI